jgi:hypothetical protein
MGKGCNNKIKHTCGDSLKAECVDYEGTTNSQSELVDEGCLSIEETTQDIYNQLEEIDVTDIDDCLEYTETDGKILIKDVVKKHGGEICLLKEQLETLNDAAICDTNIEACNLDFKCLVDSCGDDITTLGQLLQAMIDRICETT